MLSVKVVIQNGPAHQVRPCGLMDKAPDFGSGDCRFESCHGRINKFSSVIRSKYLAPDEVDARGTCGCRAHLDSDQFGTLLLKCPMGALAKCIKGRCNQHQLSLLSTMARDTSSQYNNPDAYWCPDCDYKTNEKVNLDDHSELNHKTTPSPINEELIEAIEVWKIYKLLQRMKTKEVSTGF